MAECEVDEGFGVNAVCKLWAMKAGLGAAADGRAKVVEVVFCGFDKKLNRASIGGKAAEGSEDGETGWALL